LVNSPFVACQSANQLWAYTREGHRRNLKLRLLKLTILSEPTLARIAAGRRAIDRTAIPSLTFWDLDA
jgi:hypothetical protein